MHTAIAPLSFDDPGRALRVFLTFLIHPQNFLAAVRLFAIVLFYTGKNGSGEPNRKRRHIQEKMNSILISALLMNDSISQAYIYALQHMDMTNIIDGLKQAINNPGKDTKIVLFEYYRTAQYHNDGYWQRQQLQNGDYLDETFHTGLFDILCQMFGMSSRSLNIYDRRKYNLNGQLNPHVRQVVLSIL